MGENPKGPNAPSQFHHKYPDRASGAELIVQGPAAAPRKPCCQRLGAAGPDRKRPRTYPRAHAPGTGLLPPTRPGAILKPGWTLGLWPGIWGLVCHLPAQAWEVTGREDGTSRLG